MSVEVSRDERGVLTLRLHRPEKRNALDEAAMLVLTTELEAARTDDGVRVIVIEGAGEHFCGGADIVARNSGSGAEGRPRVGSIQRRLPAQAHRLIPALGTVQVPVVCKVRGWAAGIGFQIRSRAISRSRPPTPASGNRLPSADSLPTAAPRGCCPGASARQARGVAVVGPDPQRHRSRAVGCDPPRGSCRRPRRGGRGDRRAACARADRRARAHEVVAARRRPGRSRSAARERSVRVGAVVTRRGLPRRAQCVSGKASPPFPRSMTRARRDRRPVSCET